MCGIKTTPDPISQAIGSLLLQAASQAIAQIDWSQLFKEEPTAPPASAASPVTENPDIKTPAELKVWLCQQCAEGRISPTALSQAMTLLVQMETSRSTQPGHSASKVKDILRLVG